jgi:hypothetical protein
MLREEQRRLALWAQLPMVLSQYGMCALTRLLSGHDRPRELLITASAAVKVWPRVVEYMEGPPFYGEAPFMPRKPSGRALTAAIAVISPIGGVNIPDG